MDNKIVIEILDILTRICIFGLFVWIISVERRLSKLETKITFIKNILREVKELCQESQSN